MFLLHCHRFAVLRRQRGIGDVVKAVALKMICPEKADAFCGVIGSLSAALGCLENTAL